VPLSVIFIQQPSKYLHNEVLLHYCRKKNLKNTLRCFIEHVTPQANFYSTDIAAVNSVDLKLFYERRTQSPMNEEPLILSLSTLQMIDATYTSIAGCR